MKVLRTFGLPASALLLAGNVLGAQTRRESFPSLAHDFVYTTLAFYPAGATQSGLHRWKDPRTGESLNFDRMLDDFSPANLARQRDYYTSFRTRLA
jgi:hypothetical protein